MKRRLIYCLACAAAIQPAAAQQPISFGSEIRGELSTDDGRLPGGYLFDEYRLRGGVGMIIAIELRTRGFVPELELIGPGGRPVGSYAREARGLRLRVEYFLDAEGDFVLRVRSRALGQGGRYALRLEEVPPPPPPPAPPPPPPPPPPPLGDNIMILNRVPLASAVASVRRPCLADGSRTYGQLFDRLRAGLVHRGYNFGEWFLTASGFAISSGFERIRDDGSVIYEQRDNTAPFSNSLIQILRHDTAPGRYRAFIIVYGTGITQQPQEMRFAALGEALASEGFEMPASVRRRLGGADHYLQIFVYEYARPSTDAPATLVRRGLPASVHLARSGLAAELSSICGT